MQKDEEGMLTMWCWVWQLIVRKRTRKERGQRRKRASYVLELWVFGVRYPSCPQ